MKSPTPRANSTPRRGLPSPHDKTRLSILLPSPGCQPLIGSWDRGLARHVPRRTSSSRGHVLRRPGSGNLLVPGRQLQPACPWTSASHRWACIRSRRKLHNGQQDCKSWSASTSRTRSPGERCNVYCALQSEEPHPLATIAALPRAGPTHCVLALSGSLSTQSGADHSSEAAQAVATTCPLRGKRTHSSALCTELRPPAPLEPHNALIMQVIEARSLSVSTPHNHLHIKHERESATAQIVLFCVWHRPGRDHQQTRRTAVLRASPGFEG